MDPAVATDTGTCNTYVGMQANLHDVVCILYTWSALLLHKYIAIIINVNTFTVLISSHITINSVYIA